jgi:CDP-glucose 4,6-dehydratase
MKSQTVLVTGASGLIGSALVDLLLDRGFAVIGVAQSFPLASLGAEQFRHPSYSAIPLNILDSAALANVMSEYEPDFIVHLAAQPVVGQAQQAIGDTLDANVRGTWQLLEAAGSCRSLKRVVVASSDKAYGTHTTLPYCEDFQLLAQNPYDVSKKLTEEVALIYFRSRNLPVTITRCGNVFGPYDLHASRLVPATILARLKGESMVLRSDGRSRRCFVYSRDVAQAYLALMLARSDLVDGEVFNIGTPDSISVIEMINEISSLAGYGKIDLVYSGDARNEIIDQSLDCSKIARALDWRPHFSLREGLSETIEWYRSVAFDAKFMDLLVE